MNVSRQCFSLVVWEKNDWIPFLPARSTSPFDLIHSTSRFPSKYNSCPIGVIVQLSVNHTPHWWVYKSRSLQIWVCSESVSLLSSLFVISIPFSPKHLDMISLRTQK